jgi:N-acetyl sugar amidotransferase
MRIAIVETDHFQYGLTISEIFENEEIVLFVTQDIYDKMHEYNASLCKGKFIIIKNINNDSDTIINYCNNEKIEILSLGPVFDNFEGVLKISKQATCKKIITIHNLNFWLNSKFRTPKSYRERKIKQEIVENFDYIAVEDFIYNYLKNNDKETFNKYRFIYIPFTIFHPFNKSFKKENDYLKIVLPGSIHKDRRRYEETIEVIHYFAQKQANITFSFAGPAFEDYGQWVIIELEKANKIKPGIASYFASDENISPEMFIKEMETSDLVLSTSTTEFKALGTTEHIGKTKPTAAIHDMMSFQLPGLLPSHLAIPENLKGSVFNYNGAEELKNILQKLIDNPEIIKNWKKQAAINSTYFSAKEIRKNLPFFYTQCKRCVMDNSNDPEIWFDKLGNCNYCNTYFINDKNERQNYTIENILPLIENIKKEGKNKKYDCIVGVSGGTDSAFLVYKLVEFGLKPLAVHYDNGWNSEIAISNIESLLKKLNVDLYTYVNDWEEFKDIQIAFLKAGVVDIELITDHAIIGCLFKTSKKYNTKYIFQGHNISSESILPKSWYHYKLDALNIKYIHSKYGNSSQKNFPYLSFFDFYFHSKFRKTKSIYLLDYINYNKLDAQKLLTEKYGWKNYGTKHNESVFTRFYQNYILPVKFNIDKRKAHLSSLICSGQITREEAIKELEAKPWETEETLRDKNYVIKKLGITEELFDKWMTEKPNNHLNYPSYLTRHNKIILSIKSFFRKK